MGFNLRIEYKKGISNKAVDTLSRREASDSSPATADGPTAEERSLMAAIVQPIPRLMEVLREEASSVPDLLKINEEINAGKTPLRLSVVDGLVYFHRWIYVSPVSALKYALLSEHHSTPMVGHPGVTTEHSDCCPLGFIGRGCVRRSGSLWMHVRYANRPSILRSGRRVCSNLYLCHLKSRTTYLLTGLPPSRGYTAIMVVVDRLSKYAHFAPLPARFDAMRITHLFINTVVRHLGFPKTLVSDRDSVFLNVVWKEMLSLCGTKLNFTTAYHPQSDGQAELRNRGLEQYLRDFTANRPSKWANFVPWAELALNCFHHAGLGTSHFRALYGREPTLLIAAAPSATSPPNVAELIRQRGALLVELRQNLERAQQRMKELADRHRRHVEFEVGDLVWLKLQPYRQHSVAKPESVKLSKRFYGPYEVVERIGPVAYRLRLPDGSHIHDVYHVSLLREFVAGVQQHTITALSGTFVGDRPVVTPVSILDSKIMWQDGEAVEHVLIRWSDGSDSHSWEPISWIRE